MVPTVHDSQPMGEMPQPPCSQLGLGRWSQIRVPPILGWEAQGRLPPAPTSPGEGRGKGAEVGPPVLVGAWRSVWTKTAVCRIRDGVGKTPAEVSDGSEFRGTVEWGLPRGTPGPCWGHLKATERCDHASQPSPRPRFLLSHTFSHPAHCLSWSCSINRVWLFVTLWTVAHQAPLFVGFSRQEYWGGLSRPPPEGLPNPGIEPVSPALQADSLLLNHWGSPTALAREDHVFLCGVWLFVTPWTIAFRAPPSMGFSRQEYLSALPFPSPGDLPDPWLEPASPALQVDALPLSHRGSLCLPVTKQMKAIKNLLASVAF